MSAPKTPNMLPNETTYLKKFISTLFVDNPALPKVTEMLLSYTPEVISKNLAIIKKAILLSNETSKPVYDPVLMQRINIVLTICEAEEEDDRAVSLVSAMNTNDQHTYTASNLVALPTQPIADNLQLPITQTEQEKADRKRKYDEAFIIQKPKNIKNDITTRSKHIWDWQSSHQRGYSIHIDGPKYVKGIVNSIIRDTKEELGTILGLMERDDSATLILEAERYRIKAIDIISKYGIECTTASYRNPIIKLWMNTKQITENWEEIVAEIKAFNFKSFPDAVFNFWKIIGSPYSQFVMLAIRVDPMIRDALVRDRNGKIYFRNRRIEAIDHFPFRRCYNCGSCRHFSCSEKQERCMRCSGPHNYKLCKSTHPYCPTCRGSHEAFAVDCVAFREEIERQMDKVDYTYTNILFARGF